MDNRWDYARKLRNLDTKPLQTDYKYIGRLNVDFSKIYNDLKDLQWVRLTWFNWNWRVKEFQDQLPFPYSESTRYVNRNQFLYSELPSEISKNLCKTEYEPFKKLCDDLGVYVPSEYENTRYSTVKLNRQMPGDMLWMHYDLRADETWEKYMVFLNDWAPGQSVLWGKDAITNWKSGDCYLINVNDTPHGSVNCGPEERWLASVTGIPVGNRKYKLTK